MKKILRLTALLLCVSLLIPTLSGCTYIFDGVFDIFGGKPEEGFNPPYFENYYVNKHEPICVAGSMTVYEYHENSDDLWMGGYAYHGGLTMEWDTYTAHDTARVDLPLDGLYQNISFVIGGQFGRIFLQEDANGDLEPYLSSQYVCSPPTLPGDAEERLAGIQFLVDDKVVDEVVFSNYQVPKRYTYNVSGAQKFSINVVEGIEGVSNIPILELTVWEGEAHETGHVPEPATNEPVQLIKDLKPYLIPSTSNAAYYPDLEYSDGRTGIKMCSVGYEYVIVTPVSWGGDEDIYFNLEGKYNYLTFTAGTADRTTTYDEGAAWLTVYADGKIIHEEVYSTHELQRRTVLDVSGCHQLKFVWSNLEGNENYGTATGGVFGICDAYLTTTEAALETIEYSSREVPNRPVKMVSELGTFGVISNLSEDAVFDGSTNLKTFSMGGIKYNEGIMLYSMNSMLVTKPAYAAFNLDGKYNTISFVAGHISNSNVYENDQIEIYADGKLIKTIDVVCHMIPQEYIVDVTGCKHLEFVSGKQTNYRKERPVFGIAELVAYPDGYVETDLFPERVPADFGPSCDLIDTFGFYDVYNSHISKQIGAVSVQDGYYDGTTQKNTFTVGDKTYNKGILLKTNVHLELDMGGVAGTTVLGAGVAGGWGLPLLALAASGTAYESACAMANIKNSGYTSVTFTVAMQKKSGTIAEDETTLMIGADNECVWETTVSKDMEPTTFTVELGENCDRLMFWLDCPIDSGSSHTYAIYDITLNK